MKAFLDGSPLEIDHSQDNCENPSEKVAELESELIRMRIEQSTRGPRSFRFVNKKVDPN